jgi:hypothetical protein
MIDCGVTSVKIAVKIIHMEQKLNKSKIGEPKNRFVIGRVKLNFDEN